MLASDVIAAVCNDMRNQLDPTNNQNLVLPWVDRIQKDLLHTSIYNSLIQSIGTVATTAGTSTYTVTLAGGTAVRRVLLVYDRTFNREILPSTVLAQPIQQGQNQTPLSPPSTWTAISEESARPKALLDSKTQSQWPQYYRFLSPSTLNVFPAPSAAAYAGTIEVYYEKQVATVVSAGATLTVPDDGLDIMVAGVNWLASAFLKRLDEAGSWAATYSQLKQGQIIL